MADPPKFEIQMAKPTLTLFPKSDFHVFEEVPLGRKRIDLVCLHRVKPLTTAIELKIEHWRQALWQASLNLQIAHESYIAIWDKYVHRAERRMELLTAYGVGLIAVSCSSAHFLVRSRDPVRRIAKDRKREWYEQLLRTE